MVAVGVDYRAGDVHPRQSSGSHVDAGLLKHFSSSAVRRVLARFDNAGDRGPCLVVGALDQEHLLITDDDSGHARQPQWCMSDVPTKLDDEIGDRHTQLSNRDRDEAMATVASARAGDVLGVAEQGDSNGRIVHCAVQERVVGIDLVSGNA